jgi:hypothetical protein
MATDLSMDQSLRLQIDPQPGESTRACSAIARAVISTDGGNLLLFGVYAAIGIAAYFLTPATRLATFVIGLGGVLGTVYGLQAVGRANLRRLQLSDPHSTETHFVEVSAGGVHTWCSHIDARYAWADFTKVTENNEFYMLARPNGTGAAIPKRLLDDATDAQLRDWLRSWSPDQGANLAKEVAH